MSCCGTSAIPVMEMVKRMARVDTVYLCHDNDKAGHAASKRVAELLAEHDIQTERLASELKDWNNDLTEGHKQELEVTDQCQTFC